MKRLAGGLARFLAQVELQAAAIASRRRGNMVGSRNGAIVGMTPILQLAVQRLALGARHVGKFLGLAQDPYRLVGDLLAERRKADHAAGALDQSDAEQGLQLAQARRQRRLGDEAGVRGLAEMPMLPKRDEILELFDGRGDGRSFNREFQSQMRRYNGLERFKPAA